MDTNKKNIILKNKVLSINCKIFCLLLAISILYLFKNPGLKILGGITTTIIFIICILDLINRNFKINKNKMWLLFIIFLAYNIIIFVDKFSIEAIYPFIVQVGLIFFVCSMSQVCINQCTMESIFKFGKIIFVVLLVPAFFVFINGGDSAIRLFDNQFSFTIYKILFPCTFFILVKSKKMLINIIPISLFFLAIGERTTALCLYIVYAVYLMLGVLKKSKNFYKLFFYIFVFCLIIFPFIYVYIRHLPIGDMLDQITYQETGAYFFSGRNRIWEIAIDYFKKSPLFGYGIGNKILVENGITWSTHNLYIYLLLQGGIVGTSIFIVFMRSIWMRFFNHLNDRIVKLSAAYFISIMFYSGFELTLIINSVNISMYLWLVISMGLMKINYNKITNIE